MLCRLAHFCPRSLFITCLKIPVILEGHSHHCDDSLGLSISADLISMSSFIKCGKKSWIGDKYPLDRDYLFWVRIAKKDHFSCLFRLLQSHSLESLQLFKKKNVVGHSKVIGPQRSVVFYQNFFFKIFIRCLVRISMFGGIFVFQGLIMERYNDISLNSRSVSQWVRALSLLRLSFPVTKLLSLVIWRPYSQTRAYDTPQALGEKSIILLFHSLTLSIPFFCVCTPSSSTSLGPLLEGLRLNVLTYVVLASPYHLHEPLVLLQLT